MRKDIHPDYAECRVTCSCGNAFVTRATVPEMHLELCSECHPFYTGQQKFVDTGGRVGRFETKFGDAGSKVLEQEAAEKEARVKAASEIAETARKLREEREAQRTERRAKADKEAARAAQFEEKEAAAEEAPIAEVEAPDTGDVAVPEEAAAAEAGEPEESPSEEAPEE